ncbi:MAG: hypothetical protein JO119_21005 [Acidobacteria bacterium]|nr:hypothetical protein [Acidobacteriota bacterium]
MSTATHETQDRFETDIDQQAITRHSVNFFTPPKWHPTPSANPASNWIHVGSCSPKNRLQFMKLSPTFYVFTGEEKVKLHAADKYNDDNS